jgi:hypothetical protein
MVREIGISLSLGGEGVKEQKLRSQPCEKDVMRIAYGWFYAHVHNNGKE